MDYLTEAYYVKMRKTWRMCFLKTTWRRRMFFCGQVCFVGMCGTYIAKYFQLKRDVVEVYPENKESVAGVGVNWQTSFHSQRLPIHKDFPFPKTAHFLPTMDTNQREELYNLLTLLLDVIEKLKIDYFIFGGTLIGSYRHHDVIPWDDDIDIMVNLTDRDAVIAYELDYGLYKFKPNSDEPYLWNFF